jgi:hypothetical protein
MCSHSIGKIVPMQCQSCERSDDTLARTLHPPHVRDDALGVGISLGKANLMNLILVVVVLLILFGGGGFYYGGPYVGGGLGTILLIVLIVLLLRG